MICPECGTENGARYCRVCGARVDAGAEGPGVAAGEAVLPSSPASSGAPTLLACPACGAANAASRGACGHCGAMLGPDDPEATGEMAAIRLAASPAVGGRGDAAPTGATPSGQGSAAEGTVSDEGGATGEAGTSARGSPVGEAVERGPVRMLVTVAAVALVGVAVVAFALLGARGVGPFTGASADVLDAAERAPVAAVHASSAEEGAGADLAVDGRTDTAWLPDDADRPWIELRLADATEIDGVALWPAPERRPATVRIVTDEHAFHATLLDLGGPVVVDLPEAVPASRVRIEILAGHDTDRPGLAGVEARGAVR